MNSGMMFITLKPRDERSETAQQIIDRLRVKLAKEPGGESVPDGGTGYSRRWASVERQLPVHVVIRRPGGTARWEPKIRKKLATLSNWRT
ncbi:hypothetical protein ACLK19_13960 [Escherichia coli]